MSKQGFLAALQRYIKPPWKITGPASSPEFFDTQIPKALEYRAHSPGSVPQKMSVPHAEPERVYNIQYYTRDYRRNPSLYGYDKVSIEVDPLNYKGEFEKLDKVLVKPDKPQGPFYWSPRQEQRKALLDHSEDGGYC